jgi:hypothetical protein
MRRCTRDPDGRVVVFDAGSQLHLALRRPWLLDHLDAIMATISAPDRREADPRPARERFYRQHLDLRRWMRVVVDFSEEPAWVVTVTIQNHSPVEHR